MADYSTAVSANLNEIFERIILGQKSLYSPFLGCSADVRGARTRGRNAWLPASQDCRASHDKHKLSTGVHVAGLANTGKPIQAGNPPAPKAKTTTAPMKQMNYHFKVDVVTAPGDRRHSPGLKLRDGTRQSVSSRSKRCRSQRSRALSDQCSSPPPLFRRVGDCGSTPVGWSRFLRCHYVRVGVGLGGQSFSEEMRNSVERLRQKTHEVGYSFVSYFTSRGLPGAHFRPPVHA
jgi:hypothetical protein